MISCLSTRKRKRGRKKYKVSRTKEEITRQKVRQLKLEMPKISEEIDWKEEGFRLLSNKVDKNRMADAEMDAEL